MPLPSLIPWSPESVDDQWRVRMILWNIRHVLGRDITYGDVPSPLITSSFCLDTLTALMDRVNDDGRPPAEYTAH